MTSDIVVLQQADPVPSLEGFIDGRNTLPAHLMQALTKEVFHGHAVWDETLDRLKPAHQPAIKPLGKAPDPYRPAPPKSYPVGTGHLGPQPPKSEKKPPTPGAKQKKPGWV